MKNKFSIFVLLFIISISSCSNDAECRKSRYVNLGLGIYQVSYNETTSEYTKTSLNVDSITIRGIISEPSGADILIDSLLYNNEKNVRTLLLPLDKSTNISRYQARFNEITDTITILYQKNNYYLSLECGCIKTFSIDTVLATNNFIDSVKILNHNVTNIDAEHIQIYN